MRIVSKSNKNRKSNGTMGQYVISEQYTVPSRSVAPDHYAAPEHHSALNRSANPGQYSVSGRNAPADYYAEQNFDAAAGQYPISGRNGAVPKQFTVSKKSLTPKQYDESNYNTAVGRNSGNGRNAAKSRNYETGYDNSTGGKTKREKTPASATVKIIRTIVMIILVIAVAAAGLFVALGFHVESLETVFPNVWADGVINVSELTFEETVQRLLDSGYERNAEGISITVIFPDDNTFTVTGEQVGLSLNAREAAYVLFAFGRDDTFIENNLTYIRSLFDRTEIFDLSMANYDDSIVRELTAEYVQNFNDALLDNNVTISSQGISIIKGTGLIPANADEVIDLVISTLLRAVEEDQHLTVTYVPVRDLDDVIDLSAYFERIHVDPVSSRWDVETLSATASSTGRTFNLYDAQDRLNHALYGEEIFIEIYTLEPDYTQQDIEALIFRDTITEVTSRIEGTSNRLNNVTLAARYVHDTVVNPNEIFCFNTVVGERTSARGFLAAGVFRGGLLIDSTGGGICQTSSAIYWALLHTQMEVLNRTAHGFAITYQPLGTDATVSWGQIEFRFRNNTDFPIRIETDVTGRTLTVRFIGTNLDGSYIEVESVEITELRRPFDTIEEEDDTLLVGERVRKPGANGISGASADVFQIFFDAEGNEINRRQVGRRQTYRVQNRVYLVGTMAHPVWNNPGSGDGDSGNYGDGDHGGGE